MTHAGFVAYAGAMPAALCCCSANWHCYAHNTRRTHKNLRTKFELCGAHAAWKEGHSLHGVAELVVFKNYLRAPTGTKPEDEGRKSMTSRPCARTESTAVQSSLELAMTDRPPRE